MKRIIIHIGTTKTGSSSLQSFFASNRDVLLKDGIDYYQPLHRYVPWTKPSNGDVLLYMTYAQLGRHLHSAKTAWLEEESLNLKQATASSKTVLFSEEVFWEYSFHYDAFWVALSDVLNGLFGADIHVDIVVYLRRQDSWLYSLWKQQSPLDVVSMTKQFDGFLKDKEEERIAEYDYGLSRIAEVFGRDSIIVRSYDRLLDDGINIFDDFTAAVNSHDSAEYIYPKRYLNPSITLEAAEASVWLKQNKTDEIGDLSWLRKSALLFSDIYPEKPKVYPLGFEERRSLLSHYAESNSRVAANYFYNGRFFSDDIGEYTPCLYDPSRAEYNARTLIKLSRLSKEGLALIKRHPALK